MFGRRVEDGPPRLEPCPTCEFCLCVCKVRNEHKLDCRYRRTVLAEVPIVECTPHGQAPCVSCNACDCGGIAAAPAQTAKKRRAA